MTTGGASAGTNGFLFCDLRGYTAFIEQHGDQAAAELLATYRSLVRAVIADHAGAEVRTEGDSVYVVFPAASAAVEAGLEIVSAAAEQSTKTAPIRVGVGIHAGETVATTEGLVGGAVNIAARVCAKAQAGEVLVTDTVRALTRTYLPYRYTSLGTQQLKGIAGGIPLFRVEAVPSSGRARFTRQVGARRGRVLALAGLVVVALLAAGGVYALNRPADCLTLPASTKDVVARIDPARKCVVAIYPVGQRPAAVLTTKDAVWVANLDDWTLSRITPDKGTTATTGTGASPIDLATDAIGNVYILLRDDRTGDLLFNGRDQVAKVSPSSNRVTDIRSLPGSQAYFPGVGRPAVAVLSGYAEMTFSDGRAWVSDTSTGNVVRVLVEGQGGGFVVIPVDPRGQSFNAGTGPIDEGGGVIWLANTQSNTLYKLGGDRKPTSVQLDSHAGTKAIAVTEREMWLIREDRYLTRFDPATGAMTSVELGGDPVSLAVGEAIVWVADHNGRLVRRMDRSTNTPLGTVDVGGRSAGIAVAPDGSVWVAVQAP